MLLRNVPKMKTEYEILIKELQKECDHLNAEIMRCVESKDFLKADVIQRSLNRAENKMRVLKNLHNPSYDEIELLKLSIDRFKEIKATKDNTKAELALLNARISAYESTLSDMNNGKFKPDLDSDNLMTCFEQLVRGEIDQFYLEFENKNMLNLSLSNRDIIFGFFRKEQKTLLIEIRKKDHGPIIKSIMEPDLIELKKMGFVLTDSSATKEIIHFNQNKIASTIQLLARITFEVFKLYGRRKGELKLTFSV